MKKAYMFRIYPNKNQDVILNRTISICRHLYKHYSWRTKEAASLIDLKNHLMYFSWGKPEWINKYDQMRYLTAQKQNIKKKYMISSFKYNKTI